MALIIIHQIKDVYYKGKESAKKVERKENVEAQYGNRKENKRGEGEEGRMNEGKIKQGWCPAAVIGCRSSNDRPNRVAHGE